MTAPVPYSMSTKLATQTGTGWPANGLIARCPVSKPSFSISPVMRAVRSCPWNRFRLSANADLLLFRPFLDERVLGRQQDEIRAVNRVDSGGEDLDGRLGILGTARLQREFHARPFRSPDPVLLHCQNLLGPSRQPFGRLQQFVGVRRDAEEPLLEVACRDRCPAAPARPIHDLFVGQDRIAARTPVDRRPLAIRQIALQHPQEQPLIPSVVLGKTGGNLPFPRVADADALKLPFHVLDVVERPLFRMRPVLDSGILRGHPERVPAERVQDVEPTHPLQPRHHVADHVVAHVSYVRMPRGIRKHFQAIELRAVCLLGHLEGARRPPALLPFLLDTLGLVLGHDLTIIADGRRASGRRAPRQSLVLRGPSASDPERPAPFLRAQRASLPTRR